MRTLKLLLVLGLLAGIVTAISRPADAHTAACTGQGVMTTPSFFYPGVGPTASGAVSMDLALAQCSDGRVGAIAGILIGSMSGNCGLATGSGNFDGHEVTLSWIGNTLIMSGDVVGTAYFTPDFTAGQSCMTGATRFLFTGTVVTGTNTPPVTTTVPAVTTTIPPVGGPEGPSAGCTSNLLLNTTVQGVRSKLLVQQVSSNETWVCIRADISGQGYGGRLEIVAPSAGTPVVTLPTTDSAANACWTTAGNTLPGTHPAVQMDAPTHLYIDAYRSGNQTWVCVESGSSGTRVVLTDPSGGGVGIPTVRWLPDPGTPG